MQGAIRRFAIGQAARFGRLFVIFLRVDDVNLRAAAIEVARALSVRDALDDARVDPFALVLLGALALLPAGERIGRLIALGVFVFGGAFGNGAGER